MIFAADLDRTLMYSKRAITELGEPKELDLTPVEKKDGYWVAYMTTSSFQALKELSQQHLFVPVTTRTTDQYNRFVIFPEEISIKYAITSNGANILCLGIPLEEWSEHINTRLQSESISQAELLSILHGAGFHFDGQMRHAGKQFFYYILNNLPSASDKKVINELVGKYGWRISLQGRKLYFIPQAINKGSALEYICKHEGMKAIAGAGDSILDWDFLQNCQYRFVPRHGELAGELTTTKFTLTKKYGVSAGDEILQQFLKLLPLKT
jgi:hydroxymethylpyrimidine pyrophosphatase-like HAD family hydrolase